MMDAFQFQHSPPPSSTASCAQTTRSRSTHVRRSPRSQSARSRPHLQCAAACRCSCGPHLQYQTSLQNQTHILSRFGVAYLSLTLSYCHILFCTHKRYPFVIQHFRILFSFCYWLMTCL